MYKNWLILIVLLLTNYIVLIVYKLILNELNIYYTI